MPAESDTQALTAFSDGLAAAVEHAARSVVTVNARRRLPATGIAWDANTILTSDHVIERDEKITVTLPSGTEVPATIAGRDAGSDIALLRVEGVALVPIERSPSAAKTGQIALSIGRPGPGGPMASFGVVSFSGGPWRTFRGAQIAGYLRSDTTFYPGFSGGPLIDSHGQMLGLNSSTLGRGSGLTLPIDAVQAVVAALASTGRIKRGYLGVSSQAVRLPEALTASVAGQETGLLLTSVEPGSPAAAGLMIGDILVSVGGSKLESTDDLQGHLGPESVGQAMAVSLFRGGALTTATITTGERT